MSEPAEIEPGVPTVVLDGREWPIPELVWRDLKKCRAELIELNRLINDAVNALPPEKRDAGAMGAMSQVFNDLSNDDFDRLIIGPIVAGLQSLHPSITRDEFEAWTVSEADRQMAWLIVRRQSGLFVFRDAPPSDDEGEAQGESQPPSSTGTERSTKRAATSGKRGSTGGPI
jgi:hypothetical protein